ncbi:MAG: hypothetical protein NWT00_05195 [Beijerinckiaceae bacterium]|nr:hypothetical protein [Beijerinckiaceae bacterium]
MPKRAFRDMFQTVLPLAAVLVFTGVNTSHGQPVPPGEPVASGDTYWRPRYPSTPLPKIGNSAFSAILADAGQTLKAGDLERIAIVIKSIENNPVIDAKVLVSARARDVVRYMLTQPQVKTNLGNGKYLIEGLRFNMTGAWLLDLEISSGGKTGKALLELEIR